MVEKRGKREKELEKQQPYDGTIKAIFQEDAPGIVARLVEGAVLEEVLDIEVLRPPMRADRAYRGRYKGEQSILQMEFQAAQDEDIPYRSLVYHAVLLRQYRLPVISLILYLFQDSVVQSPLRERCADQELLTFHYRVVALWKLDAQQYVREHDLCMYTLLPAMANADAEILLQAIDELAEHFREQEAKLAQRLLWFSTFLRRSTMVQPPDKQRVEDRLDTFEQLLEQDEFVRKQRALGFSLGKAEGKEEGKAEGIALGKQEGKAEGEIEALRRALVAVVKIRYPFLTEVAQQRSAQISDVEALNAAIEKMAGAPDQQTARFLLDALTAS